MWEFANIWLSYRRGKAAGLPGLIAIIVFLIFCHTFDEMLSVYKWLQLDDLFRYLKIIQNDGFHIEVLILGFLGSLLALAAIILGLLTVFMLGTILYTFIFEYITPEQKRKRRIERLNAQGIYYIPEKEPKAKKVKYPKPVKYKEGMNPRRMAATSRRKY
ncbi:hypothetical protein LCY76_23440 [Fictibacillus sp. KIGAM418]|uniref:Uncharacterized protein n=1 Tax=Fictibacillus marinisediminis TaxID=2878389 RepID=A0A9X1XL44_9BACL|nr:hypothetical protein [Fictibacillus marinisediminis]MCK6259529.1 hypothetical protein [Fictibacillus marinisediminis]